MKNIRKIVAILAAALMLFSVMPMSAFAADGDAAVDCNFDDGGNGGFERSYNENGYIVFDATTADWQNTYAYMNLKANTLYKVTFSAKANKEASLAFKINNNWSGDTVKESVAVTTDWQDYELIVNSGELAGAIVMFASDYTAADAPIYSIDNLKIVETMDPATIGKIVNGDFETGVADGWNLPQSGEVKAEAAHDGSYGINIKGSGSWGGMLDQTIPVNAGKSYEIAFWLKINATGVNIQIKDGDTTGANIAGDWVDMNKAGDWKQFTYIVTPTTDSLTINFCGSGAAAEDAYVDSFTCAELKEPSFDGYIYNGDFETGKTDFWESVWNSAQISIVEGRNGGSAMQINYPGQWQIVRQKVTVTPNTDYVYGAYTKNAQGVVLLVKSAPADQNIKQAGISNSEDWKKHSVVFNSGDCTEVYLCVMSNAAGDAVVVDDFFMFEKQEASNDGYLINGTFETGDIAPWDNLWGSCPKAEVVKGGYNDNFSLDIVSGEWKHVRQTNIAVEANTDYKITAWAKNAKDMSLLIKDGGDSKDLKNVGVSAGEEWTEFTDTFNTGDYTSIIFSLMGCSAEAYGSFDNIVMEKVVAEHTCEFKGEMTLEATCELAGEMTYTCDCGKSYVEEIPPYHNGNLTYVPAVEATDCANPGNIEYYTCPWCNEFFTDINASEYINPWYIEVTVDCVVPEGLADCASWICATCGNENYGEGEHDVMICQGGICFKCDAEIEGYGCQNYDTPACEDGVCYYCGGFVAGLGHENGAWSPCLDGECAYGCGLIFPATEEHVDADGNSICDNCYNCVDEHTFASFDPCYGGECLVCFTYVEGAHVLTHTPLKNADCAEAGNLEHWSCEVCNTIWLDKDCTEITTSEDVVIAQKDHEALYACDQYCMYCGEKKFPRAKHNILYVEAKAAVSCVESGNVEYWYCEHCNAVALDAGLQNLTTKKAVEIFIDHTVDNSCDTDCNVCGIAIDPWHVREYGCSTVCSSCGAAVEPHYPHLFEFACTTNCADCGIENPDVVDHDFVDGFCTVCNEKAPNTCIHEYLFPCDQYCMWCMELTNPNATHTYDDDADLDCNDCGEIREVEITIVVLTHTGVSVSEEVNGLAFSFAMNVSNVTVENVNEFVSGLVNPLNKGDLPLLRMGAIVSNAAGAQLDLSSVDGAKIKDVNAKYLLDADSTDGQIAFAVRVINIPNVGKNATISARPYFVYELDGVECIVYGDVVEDSYQNVLNG